MVRDLRRDLEDRAARVEQEIKAEQVQFATRLSQLRSERDVRVSNLRAQLQVVNRLIEVATWQHNARFAVARALALAAAAEMSVAKLGKD